MKFQIIAVDSANAGLEVLKKTQSDFLVCDIAMPFQDGHSLICYLRALEGAGQAYIPVIALSALSPEEDCQQNTPQSSAAGGFQTYLMKPIEPDDLIEAVLNFVCKT